MLVVFFVFVIGRYTCNKCDAQIDKDEGFVREQRTSYVLGIWLLGILLMGSVAVTMVGNVGSLQAAESSL